MTAPGPSRSPSRAPVRRRPAGRYDAPSLLGQRFLALVLTVMLLALLVAGGALLYERFDGDAVRGRVLRFDIRSDRALSMEVEVAKASGSKAYCVIRARSRDGLEVGRDVAVLDATGTREQLARREFVLATSARAVTAELAGCTADVISKDDPAP